MLHRFASELNANDLGSEMEVVQRSARHGDKTRENRKLENKGNEAEIPTACYNAPTHTAVLRLSS